MGEYQEKADKMNRLFGEVWHGRIRRQLDQYGQLMELGLEDLIRGQRIFMHCWIKWLTVGLITWVG